MNTLNNKLIYVISIIFIMNNVYGQPGSYSGGTKVQTDLILNVSYNKSSGYDGDNITIQYILSNVGTKKNQEALNIIIPENIPSYFAKPSRKLLVSNDKLTDSDPQNRYIGLNTSKVEEASEYKLLLDTNGCLIINCSKLDSNNNITIYYSTYINYTGNENANSFSSVNVGKYYENVRNYSNPPTPFVLQTRPIIVSVQDIYYSDEKYYILNNSEININYYLGNAKNKNISYIYKTKNRKYFTELTPEKRINTSGEVYFGIKLDGEPPKYNQSIFIVEDLATHHNLKWSVLYFLIIFISMYIFKLTVVDDHLKWDERLRSHILPQVIVLLILLALDLIFTKYIYGPYYSDVFLLQLGISFISYIILINLINSLSDIWEIVGISLVSTASFYFLPNIISSSPSITSSISSITGLAGIGIQTIFDLIFPIIIGLHIYNYMNNRHWLQPDAKKGLFVIGSVILIYGLLSLKKSFAYPISINMSIYIGWISMSTVICSELLLKDMEDFINVCKKVWQLKDRLNDTGKTESNNGEASRSSAGEASEGPSHEGEKK
jgi:hypothetical protein